MEREREEGRYRHKKTGKRRRSLLKRPTKRAEWKYSEGKVFKIRKKEETDRGHNKIAIKEKGEGQKKIRIAHQTKGRNHDNNLKYSGG